MDEFARSIGYAVLSVPLGVGFLYLLFRLIRRFPAIAKVFAVLALLTWGAIGVLGVPLVAYFVHARNGNYGVALGTLAVGAVVYLPWALVGLPALLRHLGLRKSPEW